MFRPLRLLVAVPFVLAAACNNDKSNGGIIAVTGQSATVRFVNATNLSLGLTNSGLVVSPSGGLVAGISSTCLSVSANALIVTNSATGTAIQFSPVFAPGGSFTVIAFQDSTGAVRFAVLDNTFTATTGNSGIRVFNAAAVQPVLTFSSNGTTLASGIAFGTASPFVNVPSGTGDIVFSNQGAEILDAGTFTFGSGSNTIVVVAPTAPGSTTLRAFTVPTC